LRKKTNRSGSGAESSRPDGARPRVYGSSAARHDVARVGEDDTRSAATSAGRSVLARLDRALVLLFTTALVVRFVYLVEMARKSPFWGHPYLDAAYYLQWGRQILSGDLIGHEVFVRAPLYPYFLAFLGRLFGLTTTTVEIAQAILGALTCLFVALLGTRAFDRRIGLVAGWIACFHGPLLYWGGETLIETFLLPLVLLSLWFVVRGRESWAVRDWVWSGLLAGLAGIARPTAMVLLPVVAIGAFLHRSGVGPSRRTQLRLAAIACLSGGLILGLVSLRNYAVGGDFVPVASHGGINFWTGNNARSDGKLVVVPEGIEITPEWRGKDNLIAMSVIGAEKAMGRKLKPSEVSSYWVRLTLEWVRTHPADVAKLYLRKVYYFWAGCEYTNNEDIYSFRRFSVLLSVLMLPLGLIYLPGAILMPLAVFGMILCARQWRRLFPLYGFVLATFLTVVCFFVSSRHRLPIIPVALIFAAQGLVTLIDTLIGPGRSRSRTPAGWGRTRQLALAVPLVLVLGINPGARPPGTLAQFEQFEYSILTGRALEARDAGRLPQAVEEFTRALALRPGDAETHCDVGMILAQQGRMFEAKGHLDQAVRLAPREGRFLLALGIWYLQSNDPGRARELLLEARRQGANVDSELLRAAGVNP
jgi:tetratricopeptide (TPR) repeat protein